MAFGTRVLKYDWVLGPSRHVKDGHGVLCRRCIMAPTIVLTTKDPCPCGLAEILLIYASGVGLALLILLASGKTTGLTSWVVCPCYASTRMYLYIYICAYSTLVPENSEMPIRQGATRSPRMSGSGAAGRNSVHAALNCQPCWPLVQKKPTPKRHES